jgi:predicted amidohydrolase
MEMKNPKSNLIESFSSDKWTHWVPREEIAPIFERTTAGETPLLKITSAGDYNNYGKWLCQVTDIPGDTEFDFSVEYHAENIEYESVSLYVILTWKSQDGEMLRREYADQLSTLDDNWKRLQKTVVSPANAWSLTAELAFRWDEDGSVTWRNPILYQTDKAKQSSGKELPESQAKRVVKVATTSIISRKDPDKNLEAMLRYIEEAGRAGADIICLTETFYGVFSGIPPCDICQPVPGELTRTIAAKAREVNSYVILSLYERDGKEIYNTAVLIDRKGEIAGKYRKVHLPLSEVEDGVTPGSEYKVFDTDFGKIGILVCWDQAFPEAARVTADKGAEIIFIPTIGDDELQTRARAKDNGVYVVVAGMYGPDTSRIINPNGDIIATVESQNPEADEGVCVVDIDLDKRYYTYWLSVGPCYSEHRHVYRKERRVDTYK